MLYAPIGVHSITILTGTMAKQLEPFEGSTGPYLNFSPRESLIEYVGCGGTPHGGAGGQLRMSTAFSISMGIAARRVLAEKKQE